MKHVKTIFIYLTILLYVAFNSKSYSQESKYSKRSFIQEVDSVLKLIKNKWNVPGLAIGVVKDGEVIFKKGYGFRNLKSQLPVTTETLFSTGSSTKSFTANGIGILVDEGGLSWDDRVKKHLPEFELKDSLWSDQATVIDILSHRTGLPAHNMMQFAICDQYGRDGIVERIKYLDLSESFRTVPQYQNQMYQVATVLIEKLSGKSWEDFTRERILDPLDMKNTTFPGSNEYIHSNNIATRYAYTPDGSYVPARPLGNMMREISGSGSIFSNVDDMCNWLIFNINEGTFKNKRMVSQEAMGTLLAPHIPISRKLGNTMLMHSFALGWDVMAYRGHLLYNKPGGYIGITSQVVFIPDKEIGLILFANLRSQMAYWIITLEILDRLLGFEPMSYVEKDWSQEEGYIERVVKNLQSLSKPEHTTEPTIPSNKMTGKYRNNGYGDLSVYIKDGNLRLNYVNDTTLIHFNENTYQSFQLFEYNKYKFITNTKGIVTGISVPFESKVNDIVFMKMEN
ncbi:MAG TPA: hypothetical protein DDY13_13145 [Cytophagales bacterium]|jgi:CubicO group peptidase (beta-lactamase class C family)|nr:hypothetical protein [Cytophagales bacterium]